MILFRKKKYLSGGSLSKLAWRRLLRDPLAIASLSMIGMAILVAMLGYLLTPDSTPFSNEQHLELATQKPGFKVRMLKVKKNMKEDQKGFFHKMLFGTRHSYWVIPFSSIRFEGDQVIIEEFAGVPLPDPPEQSFHLADVAFALDPDQAILTKGDTVMFTDINGIDHREILGTLQKTILNQHITTKRYPFGSDQFGRDMLSRLLIGTRVSLSVGIISVAISLLIGLLLGSIAGFFRGWIDDVIMWFINVVWSIPTLLLVIALTFALGKGFWQVFIAVGLTMWVEVARVVRGQIISIREKEYVEAGRALGYQTARIITRHILPNVLAPVIVISAANFASAILLEAGLSFLGIGVQPPMPSWGSMIRENYAYLLLDSAYLAILPGVAIMVMVLAFMLLGNALRDALDVRTAGR
ncbi:MAG TPA: ABC transporter permease [Bacteroidales bacterium]|nr:ABC transporter permease [Bacteroidales bacterium]